MMRRQVPTFARQHGFSLLEAIVALTIFSICVLALYGWLSVNVNALARVEASQRRTDDGRLALAMLEAVNPMAEPQGERALPGGVLVRWRSREVVPPGPGVGPAGNPLIFDLGLYDLDVEVLRNGRETSRFGVRRAGWKSARSLDFDAP